MSSTGLKKFLEDFIIKNQTIFLATGFSNQHARH